METSVEHNHTNSVVFCLQNFYNLVVCLVEGATLQGEVMPKEGDKRECGGHSFEQKPGFSYLLPGFFKCLKCGMSHMDKPRDGCDNILEYRYPPRPNWSNVFGDLGWYYYSGSFKGWIEVK